MLGAIIGAVGSLAGNLIARKSAKDERKAQLSDDATRFVRLREGAEAAGFNPLTALQYGGTTSGFASGGLPPLASAELVSGLTNSVADLVTGESAMRRQRERLETELATIRLDQARADVIAGRTREATAASSLSLPGANTRVGAGNAPASVLAMGRAIDPTRSVDQSSITSGSGVSMISNQWTGGAVAIPGNDGEPWGIDELATAALVGLPQVAWNNLNRATGAIVDYRESGVGPGPDALRAVRDFGQSVVNAPKNLGVQFGNSVRGLWPTVSEFWSR